MSVGVGLLAWQMLRGGCAVKDMARSLRKVRGTHSVAFNGGLLRWPVKLMIPAGFGLLELQGVAEIIKRIAVLAGVLTLDPEAPLEQG